MTSKFENLSTKSSKRSKSYSKIFRGATVRPQADVPSIPSRFQRILVENHSVKHRFSKKHELKMKFNTDPGPGTYEHKIRRRKASAKIEPPGFETGDARFREETRNDEDQLYMPGPGTYENEKPKKNGL